MRVAFYGGSFNPPHYSHFLAVAWALCTGEVDQVWMVPCYAHAFSKELAPYQDRINMCKLIAQKLNPETVQVSNIEEEIGGVSFTVDTIKTLQKKFPEINFRLLVGTDILNERDAWKEFDHLIQIAPLLLVGRSGYEETQESSCPLPPLSSTQIRQLLKNRQVIHGQVPEPIIKYIKKKSLYQNS